MIPPWRLWFRPSGDGLRGPDDSRFVRFADAVSEGMGSPANIIAWLALVIFWFAIFAYNPNLQDTNFLPAWFTSNAFNFPLNTITTLAELFIGFLIAAAANRVEKRNYQLHQTMLRLIGEEEGELAQEGAVLARIESKLDRLLEGKR